MSPEQKASKLLDVADGLRAVQHSALICGADITAVQIDGNEADAVHEVLQAVKDRLDVIASNLAEARAAAA